MERWGSNFWACACFCARVCGYIARDQDSKTVCAPGCPVFLGSAWKLRVSSSLQHHDVSLQRPAAASLPGLPASPRGSLRAPEPRAALRLSGGGPPAPEPPCGLHPPDPMPHKSARLVRPRIGLLFPAIRAELGTAAQLRAAEPRRCRVFAPHLPGLRVPQVRRKRDPGTVRAERWVLTWVLQGGTCGWKCHEVQDFTLRPTACFKFRILHFTF